MDNSNLSKIIWGATGALLTLMALVYLYVNKEDEKKEVGKIELGDVYIPFQSQFDLSYTDKIETMNKQYQERKKAIQTVMIAQEEKAEKERLAKLEEERKIAEAKRLEEERKLKEKQELEKKKIARQKEKEKSKQLASRGNSYQGSWQTTQATHYSLGNTGGDVPACGVINLQQTGTHYQGMRIVAANTKLYPCGSVLEIKSKLGAEKAIVMDTGGFLKSRPRNIDILVRTEKEAYALGRYNIEFRVLRKGW